MSVTVLEYKCPCCGGAIEFNAKLQKMKCPYCDTEFETEALQAYEEDKAVQEEDQLNWDTKAGREWQDGEESTLSSYVCKSCGGELVCDENTAATSCPYCGNPIVLTGRISGTLKPDYVIPFRLDKKAAKEALRNYIKGKKMVPKLFKDENHLDEIKGIYVPFWLFDADAQAHIRYRATRIHTWADRNYTYTRTSHFAVIRDGEVGFRQVPVDGSSKMQDDLMESIEPFDFSRALDFETAYLAGYLADKYDVSADDSISRANDRIRKSTSDAFASTVHGYAAVTQEQASIKLNNSQAKYALYPVWLLNTSWNGKNYTFAMNGQTGKFVGDLPLDKKAFALWAGGIGAIAATVGFALLSLLWFLG